MLDRTHKAEATTDPLAKMQSKVKLKKIRKEEAGVTKLIMVCPLDQILDKGSNHPLNSLNPQAKSPSLRSHLA